MVHECLENSLHARAWGSGNILITQKELAVCVEGQYEQAQLKQEDDENTSHSAVVSSQVREIARSTLNLSDLEIDNLFSGKSFNQPQVNNQEAACMLLSFINHIGRHH